MKAGEILINGIFNGSRLDFLQTLSKIFQWDVYEKDSLGKRMPFTCRITRRASIGG